MKALGIALLLISWTVLIVATINCIHDQIMAWQDRKHEGKWWVVHMFRQGSVWRMW